ncbi:hypothetical protein [Rathayibacter tritici]|uniref:hypothetical protein n=1 Tax=Rathayibacter tritici TaxID=33888 RepID=UPI00267A0D3F
MITAPRVAVSNAALRAVNTMADHPLPAMLREGLVATVSSDDPPYFGGYVDGNDRALVEELGMDDAQRPDHHRRAAPRTLTLQRLSRR